VNAVRAILADRRRSQRGSVLSGVLIITAFLAIISGALMTELSTNFLLSNALVNRVNTEATVNSAAELAMNQLGNTPISAGCPDIATATVTMNGRIAVPSYLSCWPTLRRGEPQFTPLSSGSYTVDATHALPASGLNDYIVGDSGGTVHDYGFGQTSGWSVALGGSTTAPAMAMVDPSGPPDVSILVPVSHPTTAAAGCDSSQACVALLSGLPSVKPSLKCYMPASTTVVSAAASGKNFPRLAYFGDAVGSLYAYDATEDGGCAFKASAPTTDGDDGVLAGPLVMPGSGKKSGTDAVYVVVGDNVASYLVYYTYRVDAKTGPTLTEVSSLPLPAPSAKGLAFDGTSLPARLSITFAGGRVALVRIQTDFTMSVIANTSLGTSISDSPFWCHCPGSADVIGVGGGNGALYLLDPSLNTLAALPAGGPAISTTPQSDGKGDWFFGADNGYLYEAQQSAGQPTMAVVARFGPLGGVVGSGAQVGACPAGLCAYLGTSTNDYVVQLDARDAVITSCISNTPPSCSGDKPRLWASVEVGAAGSPQTVHVQGWSYYSP